jgi:hypothetical protein
MIGRNMQLSANPQSMNLLQKVDGEQGVWELSSKTKKGLHEALVAFDLSPIQQILGWRCGQTTRSFFSDLDEPVHLCDISAVSAPNTAWLWKR